MQRLLLLRQLSRPSTATKPLRTLASQQHHLLLASPSISNHRWFHSSPIQNFPVRRRRKGGSSTDTADAGDENPLKHEPVTDTAEFCNQAKLLLDKLETALEPMKAKNDPFIVKRSQGDVGEILTLDLGPKIGTYRIEVSQFENVFEYTSPISGKNLYVLSKETGEWVGTEDGHFFEGILVRDLIRHCQGLPAL